MRKSNVLIVAILIVASVFFLWLWNFLNFNLIDPVDLIITIVWWVIIIGACIAIHIAEKKRRERLRTVFVSDGFLVNGSTGLVRLETDDPRGYVGVMRDLLRTMDYDVDDKISAGTSRLRFNFIVHSSKFADGGNTWEGYVINVNGPRSQRNFSNANELTRILATGR